MKYKHWLTAPFIYSVLIPLVILDVLITLAQKVSFPIYGIPTVRRRDYFQFNRHKLKNLPFMHKVNCIYCEYVNCLLEYSVEISARLEYYFCPLKHKTRPKNPHRLYDDFIEHNDKCDLEEKIQTRRKKIRACDTCNKC